MANDDLIFHTPQNRDITTHNISLNRTAPIFGTFDRPSESRARSRHHFRRGAISEPSGQSLLPLVDGERAAAQTLLHIRSVTDNTDNEIEIIFVPPNNRQSHNSKPPSRIQIDRWQELADQIHRGLLNISNPTLQHQIDVAIATLQSLTTNRPSQNRPAMEQATPFRDTFRFGREGWPTVDPEDSTTTRPATIPGSNFVVPDSTLNLFQSVDIFAPPPPRTSTMDHLRDVNAGTARYLQDIRNMLNDTVADIHGGRDVPPGRLFTLSMEVSRVSQLMSILVSEFNEAQQAAEDNERSQDQSSNYDITEAALPTWTDDDASSSEGGEPEGWANIDLALEDDYPQEVCFHIGNQQVTFPIEVVENWMMNAENWDRLEARNAEFNRRAFDRLIETGRPESITHSFVRPDNVRSRRPIARPARYEDAGDSSEDDEDDYWDIGDSEDGSAEPVSFFSDSDDDMPGTEDEAEEEDEEEAEEEDEEEAEEQEAEDE